MNRDQLSVKIGASGFELWSEDVLPTVAQVQAFWKKASLWVRVPLVICSPLCTVYFSRVTFLGIGMQIGW